MSVDGTPSSGPAPIDSRPCIACWAFTLSTEAAAPGRLTAPLAFGMELSLAVVVALAAARLVVEFAYGASMTGFMDWLSAKSLARLWPSGPWALEVAFPPGDGPAIIAITVVLAWRLVSLWDATPGKSVRWQDPHRDGISHAILQAIAVGAMFLAQVRAVFLAEWFFGTDTSPAPAEGWQRLAALAVLAALALLALERTQGRQKTLMRVAVVTPILAVIAAALTVAWQVRAPIVVAGFRHEAHIAAYMANGVLLALAVASALRSDQRRNDLAVQGLRAQVQEERLRRRAAERGRDLAALQLTAVRSQVEPHFLWNTLGNLEYMVRKRHAGARQMAHDLLRFLEHSRPQARGTMSTVGAELKALAAYLGLMQVRLGGRLSLSFELDNEVGDTPMPPLVLQTLAENAPGLKGSLDLSSAGTCAK